jgi:hypothetical protein
VVKEDLATVFGTDEAEAAVSNEANNRTCCHGYATPCWMLFWRASTRATGKLVNNARTRVSDRAPRVRARISATANAEREATYRPQPETVPAT